MTFPKTFLHKALFWGPFFAVPLFSVTIWLSSDGSWLTITSAAICSLIFGKLISTLIKSALVSRERHFQTSLLLSIFHLFYLPQAAILTYGLLTQLGIPILGDLLESWTIIIWAVAIQFGILAGNFIWLFWERTSPTCSLLLATLNLTPLVMVSVYHSLR